MLSQGGDRAGQLPIIAPIRPVCPHRPATTLATLAAEAEGGERCITVTYNRYISSEAAETEGDVTYVTDVTLVAESEGVSARRVWLMHGLCMPPACVCCAW